jgi:hypothetical protein
MTATCAECGRVFDLLDEDDAAEWYYGHDCEVGLMVGPIEVEWPADIFERSGA